MQRFVCNCQSKDVHYKFIMGLTKVQLVKIVKNCASHLYFTSKTQILAVQMIIKAFEPKNIVDNLAVKCTGNDIHLMYNYVTMFFVNNIVLNVGLISKSPLNPTHMLNFI